MLRSLKDLERYSVSATDGDIGSVVNFLLDDEHLTVRYLVIDTSNWWFGKKVVVAPHWASRVSYDESKVFVDLSRQKIKKSPEWDATVAINREYEARLYDYYGRPMYWASGVHPEKADVADHSGSHQG